MREVLFSNPERILMILAASTALDQQAEQTLERARELGIGVELMGLSELSERCGSTSHQSIAALVAPRELVSLKQFLSTDREESLLVIVDSIEDPHNFGAILRAAECFGADAVIWSKNRGVGITPVVTKASVGASELVTLIEVANLVEAAGRCKDAGYWLVGAEVREGAKELGGFEFPKKCALVLGSEGEGIHNLLQRKLDYRVYIPLLGRIDSLNVSQAAAVLLYSARAAR